MLSLKPTTAPVIHISAPKPIETGRFSFVNMLKMEAVFDGLVTGGGINAFAVPAGKIAKAIAKAPFNTAGAETFAIPLKAVLGEGAKGFVLATRLQDPAQGRDHFALFSPAGKMLAVRQKSDDYAPGFFWSNYQ